MITNVVEQAGNTDIFGGRDFEVRPILKVGGRVCECTQCGLFFAGVGPFDRHLIGWECRTLEQMRAVGLDRNQHGVWGGSFGKPEPLGESFSLKWARTD